MTEPTFDAQGYPSEETEQAIRDWPMEDCAGCLDFVKAAWHWPEYATHDIAPHEAGVLRAEPGERFLWLATGGWSGNESLIAALDQSMVTALTWRLSAVGGLHIYRYPEAT